MPIENRDLPLVAIVTPCYDGGDFLQETIDSVQAQTYPRLVHIILDNASEDASPDIIRANLNRRVPIITRRNAETLPLQHNWSAAMDLVPAEAEWVRLLCADDKLRADSIEKMVEAAEGHPEVGIVSSLVESSLGGIPNRGLPENRTIFSGAEIGASMMTLGYLVVWANHVMIRRSYLDERKPFFDDSVLHCDVEALFRILETSSMAYVHEPISWVREHDRSITSTVSKDDQKDVLDWLILMERFGRSFFPPRQFEAARETFRRKYLIWMLAWKLQGRHALVREHRAEFARLGWHPGPVDFARALAWIGPYKIRRIFERRAHRAMLEASRAPALRPGARLQTHH